MQDISRVDYHAIENVIEGADRLEHIRHSGKVGRLRFTEFREVSAQALEIPRLTGVSDRFETGADVPEDKERRRTDSPLCHQNVAVVAEAQAGVAGRKPARTGRPRLALTPIARTLRAKRARQVRQPLLPDQRAELRERQGRTESPRRR